METKKNEAQAKPAEVKKRKRYRPSLGQMRELSRKLSEAEETVHNLVQDCDAWREKYRKLDDARKRTLNEIADVQSELLIVKERIKELSNENIRLMNAATNAQKQEKIAKGHMEECNRLAMQAKEECERLRSRNLIERIMNW